MANNTYNEIRDKIDKSSLTSKNKKILHNINRLLSKYDNNKQLHLPILIIVKAIDNFDMISIEKLLEEMLKKYNVFGGKLKDTVKPMEVYYKDITTKLETGQAYKMQLDEKCLSMGSIKGYFNSFEQIMDTRCVFLLLECMQNTIDELNEHSIYSKADYIISNNSTVGELANRLLDRYKQNEIPTNIDIKELKTLIRDNLKAEIYETGESCLQYIYTKSLKSYIASNKKCLDITDIPVLANNDNITKKHNKQGELSNLVGLEYIKDEIDKIIKFATFNQQARKRNADLPKENLNMCFLDNPRSRQNNSSKADSKRIS